MAVMQQVKTTCDLHEEGTHAEHEEINTVQFSVDGVDLEIDLCEPEASKLRDHLNRYAEAGRRKVKPLASIINTKPQLRRGEASAKAKEARAHLTEVRKWARENGWDVSDRGRVAADIKAAYANREVPAQPPVAQPAAEQHHQEHHQEHHQDPVTEHAEPVIPEQQRKPLFSGMFSNS